MQDMSFGNLDHVQDSKPAPVPVGDYTLRAVGMKLQDTKAGKGLSVEYDIVGGQYDGRKVFEFYNVMHTKQQTVEISLSQIKNWILATGGDATGELLMSTIQGLEGKSFQAKVGIQVDKTGNYDDSNTIKRFIIDPSASPTQMGMNQSAPAAQATGKKAWER